MRKALPFFYLALVIVLLLCPYVQPVRAQIPTTPAIRLNGSAINVSGTVRLTWLPIVNTPFDMFYIYRAEADAAASAEFSLIDSTRGMSFDDQPGILAVSTEAHYKYYVIGKSVGGNTYNSNIVTVLIEGIPADNAFRLNARVDSGAVTLQWSVPPIPVDSVYSVYRTTQNIFGAILSPVAGIDTVLVAVTTSTSYVDTPAVGSSGVGYYAYFIGVTAANGTRLRSSLAFVVVKKTIPHDDVSIISIPVTTARVGAPYSYNVDAVSSDSTAVIRYHIENRLSSIFISCDSVTGLITMTPRIKQIVPINVTARSNKGGYATQYFEIKVSGTNGTVSGTVTDTLDRPINGVLINLLKRDAVASFCYRAMTDSLGKYRVTDVDQGTYLVHAIPLRGDYIDQWYDGKLSAVDATPIIIADSPSVATADFKLRTRTSVLPPRYTVNGTVTDSLGFPIPGHNAAVFFVNSDFALNQSSERDYLGFNRRDDFRIDGHSQFVVTAVVDSLGNYSVPLAPGSYIALAKAPGYEIVFFNNKTNFLEADVIKLSGDSSHIDFRLPLLPAVTLGSIGGQVLDTAQGIGVRARLVAFRGVMSYTIVGEFINAYFTETDSVGNYSFGNLPPGFYLVLALPVGNYAPVFYHSETLTGWGWRWDKATPITINGSSVTGINLYPAAIPDSAHGYTRINGSVVQSNTGNKPVVGALVYAGNSDGDVAGFSLTDSQGNFVIDGLAPGSYSVSADIPGFNASGNILASPTYDVSGNAVQQTVMLSVESVTSIQNLATALPQNFALYQNYPNPFNPTTKIQFMLPVKERITITVFNVVGQAVAILADGTYDAGTYAVEFNGARLSSGVYFCRMRAGDFSSTKKLLLLK